MVRIKKNRTEIKKEYLNQMLVNRFDLKDKSCIMRILKASGDFARDCVDDIKIESLSEKPIYEKALQNIATVSIYNAIINHGNTGIEIEKCLEDISYLETVTDVIEDFSNEQLLKCITESIKEDILASNSIFMLNTRKYDDLRIIFENYVSEVR